MKKIFMIFLLIFISLFFTERFVYSLVGTDILDKAIGTAFDAVTDDPAEKQSEAEKDTAERLRKLSGDQQEDSCGGENEKCCIHTLPNPPAIPGISFISGGNDLKDATNNIEENTKEQLKDTAFATCQIGFIQNNPDDLENCVCIKEPLAMSALCERIGSEEEREECKKKCSDHGVWTALGCIDFTFGGFIEKTLPSFGIGIAGAIALLCIIYSAFILQISGGSPEKIKKAKERLTACIIGLLLIIFSIFILRVIGVNILTIPGFQ
ncbi:MAG TPA: pilin [Patescibacteria group bacterium]|nr:pilin [Patescibacteria group bacterium]